VSPFSCQAKRDIKYFPSRARETGQELRIERSIEAMRRNRKREREREREKERERGRGRGRGREREREGEGERGRAKE